jgi:hypothetical protein
VATAWSWLTLLKPIRSQILTALGVGAAAGVAVFFAGPWVAAASGWLAGVLGTVAVQAGIAFRRMGTQANLAG